LKALQTGSGYRAAAFVGRKRSRLVCHNKLYCFGRRICAATDDRCSGRSKSY